MKKKTLSGVNNVLQLIEQIRQRKITRSNMLKEAPPVKCDQHGGAPDAAPTATKLPQDMSNEERAEIRMRAAE